MTAAADVLDGRSRWSVEQGESLDLVRALPANSVDAVLTDPPYATVSESSSMVVKGYGAVGRRKRSASDSQFFEAWIREHLAEWARVLKPTGAIWLTIDWRGGLALDEAAARLGLREPCLGVWDRGGLGMGFILRHVYECFAVLPMDSYVRRMTDEPDLWRVEWTPGSRETGHNAEKPVALYQRAARLLTDPDAVILDPFCGSATTIVAGLLEGRRAIGFERSPEYVETGRARCTNVEAGNPAAPTVLSQLSLLPLGGGGA